MEGIGMYAIAGNSHDGLVFSWASLADDDTIDQARQTASVAAVNGHVALMPDAHIGKGATIGSVIPTREAIIPSAVGVDIGCGVIAAKVIRGLDSPYEDGRKLAAPLTITDLPDDLDALIGKWEARIPAGLGNWRSTEHPEWNVFVERYGLPTLWEEDGRIKAKAPLQLGTLGSGNHFLELCTDENDHVWLMLHSGSRGTGNRLAQHHITTAKGLIPDGTELPDPELAALNQGTAEFDAYIHDLLWSQAYAKVNRDRMLNQARIALGSLLRQTLAFDPDWIINNHHNYAAKETHEGRELWITRKGAISARPGQLGVIPGSMGTGSYIVRGLGNPSAYMSAAHGAGRAMSRRQARRSFTEDDIVKAMEGRTWQRAHAKALLDEIPGAYHDLNVVMADQDDLVEAVHHLTTVVNYKGTDAGRF